MIPMKASAHRRIAALVITGLWLAGCTVSPPVAPVAEKHPMEVLPAPAWHVVIKGDTLYSIAWRYNLDFRDLVQWNGIKRPDHILVGQRLRLTPPGSMELSPPPAPAPSLAHRSYPAPHKNSTAHLAEVNGSALATKDSITWNWPVHGPLLHAFSGDGPGKKGIEIGGRRGQFVHAAAPGRVVYSGDGLIGYGQLVILKHNDTFLSAYAYNDKLLVKEGDQVGPGQPIAEMGSIGTRRAMLHFEIRRRGKPVDPMLYLPAQS